MTAVVVAAAVAVPVLVVGLAVVVSYNRFVSQTTLVAESWSQVDVELQRRYDLIPNLVATIQGYADHERTVLQRVTEARVAAQAHAGDAPAGRRPYEEEVGGALRGVLAVAEGYPELKASANFLQLQRELANTEDRIAAGRRFYNGNVRALNVRARTFPSNVVAARFGFGPKEFFELSDPGAAQTPAVGL